MTEPVTLKGGGRTPTDATPLLRTEVYGTTGVGKSTFAATFPSPLWIVNFDRSRAPIIEQMPSECEIDYLEIPVDSDMLIKGIAADHLLSFDKFIKEAASSDAGGTFILDGADVWWDTVKAAKLPDSDDLRDYYIPNTYANSRYRRMCTLPMHFVAVAASRNKWEGKTKESTTQESEGFKHRLRWITSQVRIFSPEMRITTPLIPSQDSKLGRTFYGYVSLAKERPSIEGTVEPSLTYLTLYRKIYRKNPPDAAQCWLPVWSEE